MNSKYCTSSDVPPPGNTSSEETRLEIDCNSVLASPNNLGNDTSAGENEGRIVTAADISNSGQETVGHTLKRPISADKHHQKRRVFALSDEEACPDADTTAGCSGERERNEGNQTTEESRRMTMERQVQDGYVILNVSLPRHVNMGNILNNPDADSLIYATLSTAVSINVERPAAAMHHSTCPQSGAAILGSEESEDDTSDAEVIENNSLADSPSSSQQRPVPDSGMRLIFKHILLEELLMANSLWVRSDVTAPPLQGSCADDFTADDFFNTTRFIYSNCIDQHRCLHGFQELSRSDQVALMNGHLHGILRCRFAIKHNMKTGKTHLGYPSAPELPSEIGKKRMRFDYDKEIGRFREFFTDKYRHDESIMVILFALVLFNCDTSGVMERALVEDKRRTYLALLEDYLESTFGPKEGHNSFRYLTTWINCVCIHSGTNRVSPISFELDPRTCKLANFEVLFDRDLDQ